MSASSKEDYLLKLSILERQGHVLPNNVQHKELEEIMFIYESIIRAEEKKAMNAKILSLQNTLQTMKKFAHTRINERPFTKEDFRQEHLDSILAYLPGSRQDVKEWFLNKLMSLDILKNGLPTEKDVQHTMVDTVADMFETKMVKLIHGTFV
jgi:hypothetical protein